MKRDGTLLKRYCAGEFEQVWREIRAHARLEEDFREEVVEIADATMRRVAQNADLLSERLQAVGWKALPFQHAALRTPPTPEDQVIFARVAEISGAPIPPTLFAFWRMVGGINWVWDYESEIGPPDIGFDLPLEEHDALCVFPPALVAYLFDEWTDQMKLAGTDREHRLRIDLAPDYWHKANISGGSAYCIEVPFSGADPTFADERHGLPFLDYLRLAFRWGGFPGLERHSARHDVQSFVVRFGKDLMPF